jgi:hypothetical protein
VKYTRVFSTELLLLDLSKRCHVMYVYVDGELVALKSLSASTYSGQEAGKLFRREARKFKERNRLDTVTVKIKTREDGNGNSSAGTNREEREVLRTPDSPLLPNS